MLIWISLQRGRRNHAAKVVGRHKFRDVYDDKLCPSHPRRHPAAANRGASWRRPSHHRNASLAVETLPFTRQPDETRPFPPAGSVALSGGSGRTQWALGFPECRSGLPRCPKTGSFWLLGARTLRMSRWPRTALSSFTRTLPSLANAFYCSEKQEGAIFAPHRRPHSRTILVPKGPICGPSG